MSLPTDSKARKDIPITTGVLDYFPDAIAAVAAVSKAGNDKHNPGETLHWSRGKSTDQADAVARHLVERGGIDPETGQRYSAQLAWRALALLQLELEDAGEAELPRGAKQPPLLGRIEEFMREIRNEPCQCAKHAWSPTCPVHPSQAHGD